MSSILPFACGHHQVWSPIANEIHAAIWDRVRLEVVQRFVRQWASDWVAKVNAAEAKQQPTFARVRQAFHYPEDWTLNLIADNLPYDQQLRLARDAIWTWQPELPDLPLPPSHRPRSLAEKWAALSAVHDVFDLTGDKVLPWPLPEDNQDLVALTEWMRGEGGAYLVLMRAAGALTDTEDDAVGRWLEDVKKGGAPAVEPDGSETDSGREIQPPEVKTAENDKSTGGENQETRKPVCQSSMVKLFGQGEQPEVDGKLKPKLTAARYHTVQALIEAGETGLTKDELDSKSGHTDARKLLKAVAEIDEEWAAVISLPGVTGKGYRIR